MSAGGEKGSTTNRGLAISLMCNKRVNRPSLPVCLSVTDSRGNL